MSAVDTSERSQSPCGNVWALPRLAEANPSKMLSDDVVPMTLGNRSIEEIEGRWYAAQVRTGTEKAFARELIRREIDYFLPQQIRHVRDFDKRRERFSYRDVYEPVLRGYVCFAGGETQRYDAIGTGRVVDRNVVSVLSCALQDRFRQELIALYAAVIVSPNVSLPIAEGMPVRVVRGPFMGYEGIVERFRSRAQVTLRVTTLGRSTPLEVDPNDVEPITEKQA